MKKDEEYWAGLAHLPLAANLQLRVFLGQMSQLCEIKKENPLATHAHLEKEQRQTLLW
jgi:hypothetical protein